MSRKIFAVIAALALGASSFAAQADDDRYDRHDDDDDGYRGGRHHRVVRARVVDVDPIFQRVRFSEPVEHCWDEPVRYRRGSDRTGAVIVGSAVGAVIGNRVSDGRGVATVAGAIAGAAIGSELARDGRKIRHGYERHCEVRHEERFERRIVGYRVTYVHRGYRDVTRLAYDPGRYVEIADIRRRG